MNMRTFILSFVTFMQIILYFQLGKKSTTDKTNNKDYTVCTTVECTKAALDIVNSLNRSVDPCDNFYQFTCGRWVKNHPVNTSYPIINKNMILQNKAIKRIKEILEGDPKPNDTLALGKARRIYQLCMDVDELQLTGVNALNKVLDRVGGWPLLMSAEEWQIKQNYTWQQYSDSLQENVHFNGFYHILVGWEKTSSTYAIMIWEPILYIPFHMLRIFEKNSAMKAIYMSYIDEVAQILIAEKNINIDKKSRAKDIRNIVNFEIRLAKLIMSSKDFDTLYNERTIEQLQQEYDARNSVKSQINWYNTIKKIFAREGITIQPSEKLLVQPYEYLMNLASLLNKTSTRTIVNYMQWTFVREWMTYASSRMEAISSEMIAQYKRQKVINKRWKRCLQRRNLNIAISHEYAKRYAQNEKKREVNNMFANIRNIVHKQIVASTWMDIHTKIIAVGKLGNMKAHIGSPAWYDAEAIDNYYKNLTDVNGYLESTINLLKFKMTKMFLKLRKSVDKDEWWIEPTDVKAVHNLASNSILITAALMQEPVYERNLPLYLQYGSLGSIIGHEIIHGFTDLGFNYDRNGKYIKWGTNETMRRYEQLTKCFEDQYSSYKWPGLETSKNNIYVNGKLSLEENICDFAGIAAAFSAYRYIKLKLNYPEVQLQGLEDYTNDQMFFISYAHTFCDNATPQSSKRLLSSKHPRGETRIIGSLSNLPAFVMAYNCTARMKMNPNKKCTFL